jgi:hypothetical protein
LVKDIKKGGEIMDTQAEIIDVQPQAQPEVTPAPAVDEQVKQIEAYVNNELRFAQETINRALNTCVANIAQALLKK